MPQLILAKILPYVIALVAFVGMMVSAYFSGVSDQKNKQKIEMAKLQTQIEMLNGANRDVQLRTVTQYKDRIVTIESKEKAILDTIPEVLKNESKDCRIGPGFVGLHNNAASGGPLSTPSKILNAATGSIGTNPKK
jgi:hypothetical protein